MFKIYFLRENETEELEQGPYLHAYIEGDSLFVVPFPTTDEVAEARENRSDFACLISTLTGSHFVHTPSLSPITLATRRADGMWLLNGFDGDVFRGLSFFDGSDTFRFLNALRGRPT